MTLQDNLNSLSDKPHERTPESNPQTLWRNFKIDITIYMQYEGKMKHYKCQSKMQNLKENREDLPDLDENESLQWQEAILVNEIEHLEKVTSYNTL